MSCSSCSHSAAIDIGEPDGHLGGKTRNALRQFQASVGHAPDGFASASLLERLRAR